MLSWLEWPEWVWRARLGGLRVRVYGTGLLALCGFHLLAGLALLWMMPMWVAVLTSAPITVATLNAMRADWGAAATYVPLAVLSTVTHEAGHVLGARLAGPRAKSYVLGAFGRIYSEPPSTEWGRLILKSSGPLAGLAYGVLLLVLAPVTTPVGAAGVSAAGAAALNLLPLPPANSDGAAVWQSVRALLRRHA
jgi:hypothetical protein